MICYTVFTCNYQYLLQLIARDKVKRKRRRNGKKESDVDKKDDATEASSSTGSSILGNIFGSNKESTTESPRQVPKTPSHVLLVKTENITHEPYESNDEIKVLAVLKFVLQILF